MIIDSHVHFSRKKGLKALLETCDKLGIDKVCLLAQFEDAKKAVAEAPDRIIPVVQVKLDREHPSFIHLIVDRGMKGLKFTRPQRPYDDERYYPFYEIAEEYGLPVLCHTGIVAGRHESSVNHNMRPIYLDHVSRTFPELKLIMAHLGNPWWDEAAMASRYNRTLYFDLSGSSLKKRPPEYFRTLLWWDKPNHPYQPDGDKHPFDKLLFGTDTAPEWMEDVWNDYQRLLDGMEVPEDYRKKIMGDTAAEIYGVTS